MIKSNKNNNQYILSINNMVTMYMYGSYFHSMLHIIR
jgi:hypothetical protein